MSGSIPAWLTPRDAATYLRLSLKTLVRRRADGTGPTYSKLGVARSSRIRYARAQLDAWLSRQEVQS